MFGMTVYTVFDNNDDIYKDLSVFRLDIITYNTSFTVQGDCLYYKRQSNSVCKPDYAVTSNRWATLSIQYFIEKVSIVNICKYQKPRGRGFK